MGKDTGGARSSHNLDTTSTPLKVGISACLLGEKVRWDGGHKHDSWLTGTLGPHVQWVPVCPENEVGMGIPREPVHLAGDPRHPRMVGVRTGKDWTATMRDFVTMKVDWISRMDLCGFILKKDSPSCGMERVKVWRASGQPTKDGAGMFAEALLKRFPLLPAEEEGRLQDADLRDHFVTRIFGFHRWKQFCSSPFSRGRLVEFHSCHKLLLLAHSPDHYRKMGKLVAAIKGRPAQAVLDEYGTLFMEGLAQKATIGRQVNVLDHMAGYFRDRITTAEAEELRQAIADYRSRLVPLVVPVTLIRHCAKRCGEEYLLGQVYLDPVPRVLKTRIHA